MSEAKRSRKISTETVNKWYSGEALRGDQYGRTLGFPTANLDPAVLQHIEKEGVYACQVRLGLQNYRGALYLGPRIVLHETKRVLEIHIIDFSQEIYGQTLSLRIGQFIRGPLDFDSVESLKAQLKQDIEDVLGCSV